MPVKISAKSGILLIGGGGHQKVVAEALRLTGEYELVGIIDSKLPVGSCVNGIEVVGRDSDLEAFFKKGIAHAAIAVGQVKITSLRESLFNRLKTIGFQLPVIHHPSSIVSEQTEIAEGCFIAPGCIINTGVRIGANSIINTGAIIEHDCTLGAYSFIGPGAVLCGEVRLGEHGFIGANATVIQSVTIPPCTLIGAGSVVTTNLKLAQGDTAYGNPASKQ